MEALLEILIRASISIALFYALYWLLLRQSTHFKENRLFLLISLVISIVVAVIPVQYQVLIPAPTSPVLNEYNGVFNHDFANTTSEVETSNDIGLFGISLLVYGMGAAMVLLRLLIQCRKPLLIISKSKPKKINDCLVHENKVYNTPFSFFNRILINPEYFQQNEINDILTHEKVHIQERHWIDLFIIELLTVFFWFNPFIWFFERAIKRNHEYLADEGVLSRGHSPVRYQALLINRLMGTQVIGLANHFSSSLGTTRFKMMTKEKTAKRKLFRMIWAIPVLAILLLAFAKPEYQMQKQEKVKVKSNTIVAPEGAEYKLELSDGTKVFLSGNSKLEYPETFASKERVVHLEGEAYFEVSDSKAPFFVKIKNDEMIGPIGSDGKKVALSTKTGHAYIPSYKESLEYTTPEKETKTDTLIIPEGEGYNELLQDGNKTYLKVNSKRKYPKELTDKAKIVSIDDEAYFDISQISRPINMGKVKGNIGLKVALSTKNEDHLKTTGKEPSQAFLKKVTKLKGKVTDEKGNALPGTSIIIKGTSIGTVADRSGNFEINYSPEGKKFDLIASYVGYKTTSPQQIKADKSKSSVLEFDFKLKREVIKLDGESMFLDGSVPPPPPPPTPAILKSDKPVFYVVEDIPRYPKGRYGLGQYVKKQKDKLTQKWFFEGKKLLGKATVGFTINTKGEAVNIQILDKSNEISANAAKIIISKMEKWTPGSQRGKKVPVDYAMELEF